MDKFYVRDVVKGKKDSTDAEILTVYGKVSGILNGNDCGRYAVYRTSRQVMIQFSDDDTEGVNQRAALTSIAPLRGQITTMINKLAKHSSQYQQDKADEYANRLGISLLIALQGDLQLAEADLISIRDDLIEDMASEIRTFHLVCASVATLFFVLFASLLGSEWFIYTFSYLSLSPEVWSNCWHAAAIGSIGALFSIALDLRERKVKIDYQQLDNASDAVLRIMVGATSGALLAALFLGKIVSFGANGISANDYGIMVIAFAGGFGERMVANFLETIKLTEKVASNLPNSENSSVADERKLARPSPTSLPLSRQAQTEKSDIPLPILSRAEIGNASEQAIEPDEDQSQAEDSVEDHDIPNSHKLPPVG